MTDIVVFAQRMYKFVREEKKHLADVIASGACSDFPEYKFLTGKVQAFSLVESEIKGLLEENIEDDPEEALRS